MWAVITIQTQNQPWDGVNGAYACIRDGATDREFCRFSLSEMRDGMSDGCIMGNFTRVGGTTDKWAFRSRGYYTRNSANQQNLHAVLGGVLMNEFDNVKIVGRKDYGANVGAMTSSSQRTETVTMSSTSGGMTMGGMTMGGAQMAGGGMMMAGGQSSGGMQSVSYSSSGGMTTGGQMQYSSHQVNM